MNKLYIIGTGPGDMEMMTVKAQRILSECDTIVGYKTYVDLIKPYFRDKDYISTGMGSEEQRCRLALEKASQGVKTALISGGDPGVYAMSGLCIELSEEYPGVETEVVAGVTAALSGGAVLGSPLGNDFAVISLSDILTPWDKIEKRLELSAQADMAICLYNPSSHKRKDHLSRACDIILRHRKKDTICATVSNIGRDNECSEIMTLGELRDKKTDMFTTVFIGNSQTRKAGRYMVTPRGYELKED